MHKILTFEAKKINKFILKEKHILEHYFLLISPAGSLSGGGGLTNFISLAGGFWKLCGNF